MSNLFSYIIPAVLLLTIGCSKVGQQPIGEKSDQAFIQDVIVWDTAQKVVSVTKQIPKITTNDKTNVEELEVAGTPLEIIITTKAGTDLSMLYVRFTLTSQSKYATVNPVLGSIQDFTTPKNYTITSQSGKKSNSYKLTIKTQ